MKSYLGEVKRMFSTKEGKKKIGIFAVGFVCGMFYQLVFWVALVLALVYLLTTRKKQIKPQVS